MPEFSRIAHCPPPLLPRIRPSAPLGPLGPLERDGGSGGLLPRGQVSGYRLNLWSEHLGPAVDIHTPPYLSPHYHQIIFIHMRSSVIFFRKVFPLLSSLFCVLVFVKTKSSTIFFFPFRWVLSPLLRPRHRSGIICFNFNFIRINLGIFC